MQVLNVIKKFEIISKQSSSWFKGQEKKSHHELGRKIILLPAEFDKTLRAWRNFFLENVIIIAVIQALFASAGGHHRRKLSFIVGDNRACRSGCEFLELFSRMWIARPWFGISAWKFRWEDGNRRVWAEPETLCRDYSLEILPSRSNAGDKLNNTWSQGQDSVAILWFPEFFKFCGILNSKLIIMQLHMVLNWICNSEVHVQIFADDILPLSLHLHLTLFLPGTIYHTNIYGGPPTSFPQCWFEVLKSINCWGRVWRKKKVSCRVW